MSVDNGILESNEKRVMRVLVADEDTGLLQHARRALDIQGFDTLTSDSREEVIDLLVEKRIDVLVCDPRLFGGVTFDIVESLLTQAKRPVIIQMADYSELLAGRMAPDFRAYDVLLKPFISPVFARLAVQRAAERKRLLDSRNRLEEELESQARYGKIVGNSHAMREVHRMISSMAHSMSTVLLQGEQGTGKELVARAIHNRGARGTGPFILVSCSTLQENSLEAEFFGASGRSNEGLLSSNSRGTVLLDDVQTMPLHLQVKLLRLLQNQISMRVIAATSVDLHEAFQNGAFREDLYYRLNVISISIPPLRRRVDDIPLLAHHFLTKYAIGSHKNVRRISSEAMDALCRYRWPENVRELENAIERAVLMSQGEVLMPEDLPLTFAGGEEHHFLGEALFQLPFAEAKNQAVQSFERTYLNHVLRRTNNNVSEAARLASLDRSNFRRLLKKNSLRSG